MTAKLGLKHRFVLAPRVQQPLVELLRENTGHLFRDPHAHHSVAFGKVSSGLMLLGSAAEVCRSYYHPRHHPERVDAELLAKLAGWAAEEVAVAAYADWLADVPTDMGVATLDLFYWESRLGNWAALSYTADDTFADQIPPFNCRELLAIGLGVDVVHRRPPYDLHQRICELSAPETLSQPINTTWLRAPAAGTRALVPRRLRATGRQLGSWAGARLAPTTA